MSDARIEIRPATEQDVPVILQLIRELAEYENLLEQCEATEALIGEYLFGGRPVAEALIAFLEGKALGFALYFHNFSTFLGRPGIYLEDLFVRPQARRKGVGRALLREVAKIARQRRCGRLEWSVLDWNEPAIRFYKNLGAVPMDAWTTFRVTADGIERLATQ